MGYSNKSYQKQNPKLPVKIFRIEVQKKNSFRYSLFSEDGFILGVSDSTLTKHDLKKGTLIDHKLYEHICLEEEKWSIKDYLIRLLGRRDHASHELKLKGIKKGYDTSLLDEIILELEDKGYINNNAFTKKYVHDKFHFNKWGPNKIRTELIKKKIDKVIIEKVIEDEIDIHASRVTIEQLIVKKKRSILRAPEEKRRKKIFDFLFRKGYDSNVILKEIDKLIELVNK
jgi:regulatory protein